MFTRLNKFKFVYDLLIIFLAVISIILLAIDSSISLTSSQSKLINIVDSTILIIFAIDYFIRLIVAEDKKQFIKKNIPDLISIIPFNQAFQAFRVFRIFRFVRLAQLSRLGRMGRIARIFSLFAKFSNRASEFLKTNHFIYIAYIACGAILFGAVGISYVENLSFGDSLWWSIVTTTTVGYGDISPKTPLGKVIAVILMIIGIGFLGMLSGTIATYFLNKVKPRPIKCEPDKVISLDGLDDDDIRSVVSYVTFLKSRSE